MRFLAILILIVSGISVQAQERTVTVRDGQPVIEYITKPGERSADVLKRFMQPVPEMSEITLLTDTLVLSVTQTLLLQCPGNDCISLIYEAGKGETFKSIGAMLGNVGPYQLKRLNEKIELVETGDRVRIGFLPAKLFEAVVYEMPDSAQTTPATDAPVKTVMKLPAGTGDLTVGAELYEGPGAFANEFVNSNKHKKTGQAGNFKSAGGWQDGHYYVLMNGVAPGTLVQVKNLGNDQFIIAKVVTELPQVRKDENLLLRISNAGCAALDVWDSEPFAVEVSF